MYYKYSYNILSISNFLIKFLEKLESKSPLKKKIGAKNCNYRSWQPNNFLKLLLFTCNLIRNKILLFEIKVI